YAVKKKTRLHDLLNNIEVEPELADFRSVYILRKSVAEQQKERLEESLHRLERSVFTAPASSDGEAKIRAQEAQMVMQF
ncbi:sugar transporter, partial [Vibrio parahaemolyticus]